MLKAKEEYYTGAPVFFFKRLNLRYLYFFFIFKNVNKRFPLHFKVPSDRARHGKSTVWKQLYSPRFSFIKASSDDQSSISLFFSLISHPMKFPQSSSCSAAAVQIRLWSHFITWDFLSLHANNFFKELGGNMSSRKKKTLINWSRVYVFLLRAVILRPLFTSKVIFREFCELTVTIFHLLHVFHLNLQGANLQLNLVHLSIWVISCFSVSLTRLYSVFQSVFLQSN